MARSVRSIHSYSDSDPFGNVLRELHYAETPVGRSARLREERNAQQLSNEIDRRLDQERIALERATHDVTLLVLGPRGSGKSTLQKHFQLLYEPKVIDTERPAWKPVVHSNIISNVSFLLDLLQQHGPSMSASGSSSSEEQEGGPLSAILSQQTLTRLRRELRHVVLRHDAWSPWEDRYQLPQWLSVHGQEVFVRHGWQKVLSGSHGGGEGGIDPDDPTSPSFATLPATKLSDLVSENAEKIKAFWKHPVVQRVVHTHARWGRFGAGFFLNDLERISDDNYVPSAEDILKCRCQTIGVEETTVQVPYGPRPYRNLTLYDISGVGGKSSKAWSGHFTEVNSILFLFDLACFDEFEGKPRRNRMAVALDEFLAVCRNHDLRKVNIIVFLTKVDLLQRKVETGVRIQDWISSYGNNRANTVKVAKTYFEDQLRSKFQTSQSERVKAGSRTARERQLYVCTANLLQTADAQRAIKEARDIIFMKLLVHGLWSV
ncbi:P-loop containing nucleoside triphosphate hydrolase protein [Calocera viscosa TUFC12733]|uniref:p-loop containing nucleoside triphosphate hydrolase protein n=1 Tax=Calocera viscosa (strain TUFC12733) TaxID=1330018 RepID=A0A167R7B9_CALVF|nr:P-loop containing nucleoside triphosphate hydrolase protein [Calocera viscosa TUFC12733]